MTETQDVVVAEAPADEIKTDGTREVTCPFCGDVKTDSWELTGEGDDEVDTECGDCGRTYWYLRNITVDYSTRRFTDAEIAAADPRFNSVYR